MKKNTYKKKNITTIPKKASKKPWKERLPAFILLAFMIFWTIGSVLAVWLTYEETSDHSAMITASADAPNVPAATNKNALEIRLDGLIGYSCYASVVGQNGQPTSANSTMYNNYIISYYYDGTTRPYLYFYRYDGLTASNLDSGPFIAYRLSLSSADWQTTRIYSDYGLTSQYGLSVLNGSNPRSISDIPLAVSYNYYSTSVDTIAATGFRISILFGQSANVSSTYSIDFYFVIYGASQWIVPLSYDDWSSGSSLVTIPNAPLTYKDFSLATNLNYIDRLEREIASLEDEIRSLDTQIFNLTNNNADLVYERNELQQSLDDALESLAEYRVQIADLNRLLSEETADAYNIGYSDGKLDGYQFGYDDGVADGNQYTFTSLITSVVDVPVKTFLGLFDFDLLGVNMASFFLSLLTLAAILAVVKIII